MREVAFFRERGALIDTEAVLLVRDDETEPEKRHRVADECVRADDHVEKTAGERLLHLALLPRAHRTRQAPDADAERFKQRARVCSCCSVRISVGAMKALWQSFSCANQIHAAATSVLPGADIALYKAAHRHAGDMSCTAAATAAPRLPRWVRRGAWRKTSRGRRFASGCRPRRAAASGCAPWPSRARTAPQIPDAFVRA